MWDETRRHLDARSIRFVDTLPALRAALGRAANPYPRDWNGHLNALGNDLVASALAESAPLRELASGDRASQRPSSAAPGAGDS
jgi:hypothetical protein